MSEQIASQITRILSLTFLKLFNAKFVIKAGLQGRDAMAKIYTKATRFYDFVLRNSLKFHMELFVCYFCLFRSWNRLFSRWLRVKTIDLGLSKS